MTVADLIRLSTELAEISDTARLDIEVLICHVLKKDRAFLFAWPEHQLTEQQLNDFQTAFECRKKGEPIAHITGEREFWSLPLQVNPSTLIPRPDTETLVETALQFPLPDDARILDLGTGTGAIALALASEKPNWKIIATDVQADAVALAERNRARLGFDNVEIMQSDWFAALGDQQFDLIVSNPPYIDPVDPHLQQGDVRFEPLSALIADNKGLADIDVITAGASKYLMVDGWLLVEHGFDQREIVEAIFFEQGFTLVDGRRDMNGKDRVAFGRVHKK